MSRSIIIRGLINELHEEGTITTKEKWSSPQKVVHLLVWEINPIRNMKGGLKWLRKDTNPKKS